MKCPFCFFKESRVVDSRVAEDFSAVRRRRECLKCKSRFTTSEREEPRPLFVVKKDSTRERFDRNKLMSGFLKACEKRPVSMETIETALLKIERELRAANDREVLSGNIGAKVMESLREMDAVAYIRFASVYMEFEDVSGFKKIIETLPETVKEESLNE